VCIKDAKAAKSRADADLKPAREGPSTGGQSQYPGGSGQSRGN
jgi:hypothetical protein